nr:MAG TPA: hypothetical protein [Caudoviricetes sp.]
MLILIVMQLNSILALFLLFYSSIILYLSFNFTSFLFVDFLSTKSIYHVVEFLSTFFYKNIKKS